MDTGAWHVLWSMFIACAGMPGVWCAQAPQPPAYSGSEGQQLRAGLHKGKTSSEHLLDCLLLSFFVLRAGCHEGIELPLACIPPSTGQGIEVAAASLATGWAWRTESKKAKSH